MFDSYLVILLRGAADPDIDWEQIAVVSNDYVELALMQAQTDEEGTRQLVLEWRVEGVIIQRGRLATQSLNETTLRGNFTQPFGVNLVRQWFDGISVAWNKLDFTHLRIAVMIGRMLNDEVNAFAAHAYTLQQQALVAGTSMNFSIQVEASEESTNNVWDILHGDTDDETE